MGLWPSGVTIVTTRSDVTIHGMTVSDFSGVSLSPPLVSVCCNSESRTNELIAEGGCFAVNVLASDQQDLSNRFASSKTLESRFEGVDYVSGETGSPLIRGALLNLDCTLVASHEAGDHFIHVGEIQSAEIREGKPLLYFGGGYRELAS